MFIKKIIITICCIFKIYRTGHDWQLFPSVTGDYFNSKDLLVVRSKSTASCEVNYEPMTMTNSENELHEVIFISQNFHIQIRNKFTNQYIENIKTFTENKYVWVVAKTQKHFYKYSEQHTWTVQVLLPL